MKKNDKILEVVKLNKCFPIYKGVFRRKIGEIKAAEDISFSVKNGETIGLVGESGSGKTTVLHSIIRSFEPTSGKVLYYDNGKKYIVNEVEKKQLKHIRKRIRMIFQDPDSALNPRMTVRQIISEPLLINNKNMGKGKVRERVEELLVTVGLKPEYMSRYPNSFSGGQKQRIGIARALALEPRILLADEPTSALDVSIQAQILNLLMDLQDKLGLSIIIVSHDLSVVRHISDKLCIMYLGRAVEFGSSEQIYGRTMHPYTEALLSAVPEPDPEDRMKPVKLAGDIPSIINKPKGCVMHTRCLYAKEICKKEMPEMAEAEDGHYVCCHFAGKLELETF